MRGACHIDCTLLADKIKPAVWPSEPVIPDTYLANARAKASTGSNQSINDMWQKGAPGLAQISALLPINGASSNSTRLSQC